MEEIQSYFKDGSSLGVKIAYSRDRKNESGSLTALAKAIRSGSIPSSETLLVYYGNILSNLDIRQMVKEHRKAKADATLIVSKWYTMPVRVATVRKGRVVAMEEKPQLDVSVTKSQRVATPFSPILNENVRESNT